MVNEGKATVGIVLCLQSFFRSGLPESTTWFCLPSYHSERLPVCVPSYVFHRSGILRRYAYVCFLFSIHNPLFALDVNVLHNLTPTRTRSPTFFKNTGSTSSLPRSLLAIPHPTRTNRAFLSRCLTSNALGPRRNSNTYSCSANVNASLQTPSRPSRSLRHSTYIRASERVFEGVGI